MPAVLDRPDTLDMTSLEELLSQELACEGAPEDDPCSLAAHYRWSHTGGCVVLLCDEHFFFNKSVISAALAHEARCSGKHEMACELCGTDGLHPSDFHYCKI